MDIFLFNTPWMVFNLYLALLPVVFCWFLFRVPNRVLTLLVGIVWLLYLPNTIYVFTDLHHLVEQWPQVDAFGRMLLLLQYGVLEIVGLTCFLIAFYPFEKILQFYNFKKDTRVLMIVGFNFLMGFAMVLGKFERINSWDVFLIPKNVILSSLHVLGSYELVALGILFGLFTNFFYFLFRDPVVLFLTKRAHLNKLHL